MPVESLKAHPMTRIACIQFSQIDSESENLKKCVALIDKAAAQSADLIVLPEMSNWSAGLVRSRAEALAHGSTVPGPFLNTIGERAQRHGCHIAVGIIERLGEESFITSVMMAPDGRIVLKFQKQIPFGAQRVWASPGRVGNPVVSLPFGRVGIYICADGLVPETARMLALQGARLLINTLHSGGDDETLLHVPARAVENRIWVASANKVGPRELGAIGTYSGGSQIVSPVGVVAARADNCTEGFIFADVDLSQSDDKMVGGEDILRIRRPECYRILIAPPQRSTEARGPASLGVAALQPNGYGEPALEDATRVWRQAAASGAKLMVLPELFSYDLSTLASDPSRAASEGENVLACLGKIARETSTWGVVNLVERDRDRFHLTGFLIDHRGDIAGRYRQVHIPAQCKSWAMAGNEFTVFDTAIGRIGLLCGADALLPEAFRVLSYLGAATIAVAGQWRADYEIELVLPERVAENRVNIVFSRRHDSPSQRGSAIVGVIPYPSEPHWKVRSPDVIEAKPDALFVAHAVNLAATQDKSIGAQGCDLMSSAAHAQYGALTDWDPFEAVASDSG